MRLARPAIFFSALIFASLGVLLVSLRTGAVEVSWGEMFGEGNSTGVRVFRMMRIPRTLMGFLCGGALGVCGAALQGLFRNPLADPALVGVSGGAALGAVGGIVMAGPFLGTSPFILPICAFLGALAATFLVQVISLQNGRVLVSTLLLAGIAVNALTGAGIGWMIYGANDSQLRDFTFWSLGSLAGTSWNNVLACAPFLMVSAVILLCRARALNALSLGESDAWHMGTPVESVKRSVLAASALAVGAGTAFTGIVGFIGLVAPHLVRMLCGADHRLVLPASFLIGGSLLSGADVLARVARAPAEVPVGIIVATIGAPFFVALLLRGKGQGL